jgi:hypothetical protein
MMSKQKEENERKKIQSDQPALKPGGDSATSKSRKVLGFDCADVKSSQVTNHQ